MLTWLLMQIGRMEKAREKPPKQGHRSPAVEDEVEEHQEKAWNTKAAIRIGMSPGTTTLR